MKRFIDKFIKISDEQHQILKYLIVGVWNTVFGILFYALLIFIFGENYYLILAVLSNIVCITQSYLTYKLFVFKTKGHILREYIKCYGVYGTSMVLGLVFMYVLVDLLKIPAVYSNIIVTGILTIISYVGHKYFTFSKNNL